MFFIVLATTVVALGGCYFPGPWPDREERHEHRDGGYEHDGDRGHDHERGEWNGGDHRDDERR